MKLIILFSFLIATEEINALEYWLQPPADSNKYCTKKSCDCVKSDSCTLNNYLIQQLQPGDSVYFKNGNYPAFEITNTHGTAALPITLNGSIAIGKAEVSLNPKNKLDLIEIKKSSHIKLTGFNVHNAPRAGIRVNNSHHITLENNKLTHNGVWGIFTNHANNFKATSNTIIGPAKQHGIYHSNSGDNVILNANFIQNFNGCGIHMNGDKSMGGAKGVKGDGIISNVEISNNYLSGNGLVGGSAINLDGVTQANIINNIILKNKAAGLSIFKDDGGIGSSKINVSDNLIIMAKGSRWAVNIKNSEGDNSFTNNIIVSQNSFRGIYDVLPVDLDVKSTLNVVPFTANNNVYGYGRNLIALNDKHYLPIDEWQKSYQNDQNSSKLFYKYVLSNNGKLSQPLRKIVEDKQTAKSNPYLFLIL